MAKLGLVALVVLLLGPVTTERGCRNLKTSLVDLAYPRVRDMRTTVVLRPQRGLQRPPDSLSVPIEGKEITADREAFMAAAHSPSAPTPESIARGELKYARTCVPCHGVSMKGDGPVAAKFMPPPDLLGAMTRARSDGFIYAYIRLGGAVMPSYAAQVSAGEAWDVIHYIRHMQQTSPR